MAGITLSNVQHRYTDCLDNSIRPLFVYPLFRQTLLVKILTICVVPVIWDKMFFKSCTAVTHIV